MEVRSDPASHTDLGKFPLEGFQKEEPPEVIPIIEPEIKG
jgi:hypothetical protein